MRTPRLLGRAALTPIFLTASLLIAGTLPAAANDDESVQYVIHVSVDGLRPDAITQATPQTLPHFYRLRAEGAFTDDAHTDADYTVTLPNHASQLTGRSVRGRAGHGWHTNKDAKERVTLHTEKGTYVSSVFDVVHDHGLRTAAYVSKGKFDVFERSYGAAHGAHDMFGPDDGRGKIDAFVIDGDTDDLVERFVRDMKADPFHYAFLHLRNPDSAGHVFGWKVRPGTSYMRSVQKVDALLGQLLDLIEQTPELRGRTALVLTADHGGTGRGHGDDDEAEHFTIPFYVWGPGVPRADLYALNVGVRQAPRGQRPGYDAPVQPIRNGDAANLALGMLGLPPVPGSTIGVEAPLHVRSTPLAAPEPDTSAVQAGTSGG